MAREQGRQKDYYAILGVEEDASPETIKRAYRRKAREMHPDRAGAHMTEAFQELQEAYDTLRDPDRRAAYDRKRRAGVPVTVETPARGTGSRFRVGRTCHVGTRGVPGGVLDVYLEPWEFRWGARIDEVLWVDRACFDCENALFRRLFCPRCGGFGRIAERVDLRLDLAPPLRAGERRHLEVRLGGGLVLCLDLHLHALR